MASDKRLFKRAQARREELRKDEAYSYPPDQGTVAIICSYFNDWGDTEKGQKRSRKDVRNFRKEAFALARRAMDAGLKAEVALNAQVRDMDAVLTDPSVTTIYTIGHGCLSSISLGDDIYDWWNVSEATDHLKTGLFVQRQCGGLSRELNVPLGLFALADPLNVIAATGVGFEPKGLLHEANNWLQQVFSEREVSYEGIKRTLGYTQ